MDEFINDWELLQSSSKSSSVKSSNTVANLKDLEQDLDDHSHGMIKLDYFSLDNENSLLNGNNSDQGSVESENLSWVDPETGPGFVGREKRELWPDSGSDRSEECRLAEFEVKNDLSLGGNGKILLGIEGIGESDDFEAKNDLDYVGNGKSLMRIREIGEFGSGSEFLMKMDLDNVGNGKSLMGIEGLGEFGSGSEISMKKELDFVGNRESLMGIEEIGEISSVEEFSMAKNEVSYGESKIGHASDVGGDIIANSAGEKKGVSSGDPMEVVKAGGEREKRGLVWWKVPFELLKFCAFRVSPVWTFSMAAAVMGVVLLTRRLYKMKRKSQALQLKVTMNDKKVSQFMSRTARLNEAFSVVKRVPVIRPTLPAAGGLSQWPVMSLR